MNTPTINVHSPILSHQNAGIELNREGLAALKAAIGMAEFTAESNGGYGQG